MHPAAGELLHDLLQLFAFAEGVEHRGDAAEFQRIGAEEHQVVEDAVEFGEQRPQPDGALGDLHAEHALDGEDDAEFVGEGREPVVAVGEDDDLPVVARLEELLRAPVHVAHHGLDFADPFAVEDEPQPQHPVRGGVLGADVEHHVGALRCAADADRGLLRAGRRPGGAVGRRPLTHGLSLAPAAARASGGGVSPGACPLARDRP